MMKHNKTSFAYDVIISTLLVLFFVGGIAFTAYRAYTIYVEPQIKHLSGILRR
jgi:hypothetical protein